MGSDTFIHEVLGERLPVFGSPRESVNISVIWDDEADGYVGQVMWDPPGVVISSAAADG